MPQSDEIDTARLIVELRETAVQHVCDYELRTGRQRSINSFVEGKAADEIERLQKQRDKARAALKPFADFAPISPLFPDDMVITKGSSLARRQLTIGDCRKAREVFKND